MSLITPATLHKVAAGLYGLITAGHVVTGFNEVYPALAQIRTDKPGPRGGALGARLCWNFVTTALLAQAAFHLKWARTGVPSSVEEKVAVLALTAHAVWNGIQYIRGGAQAGPPLTLVGVVSMAAFGNDLWA